MNAPSLNIASVAETIELLARDVNEKMARGQKLISDGQALIIEARAKARLAEELHSVFGMGQKPATQSTTRTVVIRAEVNGHSGKNGPVTLKEIQDYLSVKGGRIVHIAKRFGVKEDEIRKLISTPDSGITVQPRGWLKYERTLL